MQATEEVDIDDVWWYEEKWKFAFDEVSYRIKQLSDNVEGKKVLCHHYINKYLTDYQNLSK